MIKDYGGAAFPVTPPLDPRGGSAGGYPYAESGMFLRDWFAGQALPGVLAACSGMLDGEPAAYANGHCNQVWADRAYALADAMLRARAK